MQAAGVIAMSVRKPRILASLLRVQPKVDFGKVDALRSEVDLHGFSFRIDAVWAVLKQTEVDYLMQNLTGLSVGTVFRAPEIPLSLGRIKAVPDSEIFVPNLRIHPEISLQVIDLHQLHNIGVVLTAVDAPTHVRRQLRRAQLLNLDD